MLLQLTANYGFQGGQASLSCGGVPPSITCTLDPAVVQLAPFGTAQITATFTTSSQPAANIPIEFLAQGAGFSQQVSFTLQGVASSITSIYLGADIIDNTSLIASTPQALQPGSSIVINGGGFCPGTQVRFGNDLAVVTPDSLTSYQIKATVPRNATTGQAGAWGVILPDGTRVYSPYALPIDSYRNSYGFPFQNLYFGGIDFDQLTELDGQDQTYDNFFGEVRDPWALTYCAIANAILKLGGDSCFGICLTTQRLKNAQWGDANVQNLPGFNDVLGMGSFDLVNEGTTTQGSPTTPPPNPLNDFIHVQHVAQLSDEFLNWYLQHSLQNSPYLSWLNGSPALDTKTYLENCLQNWVEYWGWDYPLVSLRYGSSGHVLVAYDIETNFNDAFGFVIDVYDPNE